MRSFTPCIPSKAVVKMGDLQFSSYLTLSNRASYEFYPENTNYAFRNKIGRPFKAHGLEVALLDIFYTPVTSGEDSVLDAMYSGFFSQTVSEHNCVLVECSSVVPQQQSDGQYRPIMKMMAIPLKDKYTHSHFPVPNYYPVADVPTVVDCVRIRLLDENFRPLPVREYSTTTVVLHFKSRQKVLH
jgi:hypothetical protein